VRIKNLYKLSPQTSIIDSCANLILQNFHHKVEKGTVILPNGVACLALKHKLLALRKVTLLPEIIPLSSLEVSSHYRFGELKEQLKVPTYTQENMLLAELILDYTELRFDLVHAITLARELSALFYELILNQVSIEQLRKMPKAEHARHTQKIYGFLEYAYLEFQDRLKQANKIDKASNLIKILDAEASNLYVGDCYLVIAGIWGDSLTIRDFICRISSHQNGMVILPPLPDFPDEMLDSQKDPREHNLYSLVRLLDRLETKFSGIKSVDQLQVHTLVDEMLIPENKDGIRSQISTLESRASFKQRVRYYEYDNLFEEAEFLARICAKDYNKLNRAIVINDPSTKEVYVDFLQKYDLKFHDLSGKDLSVLPVVELIKAVADFICNPFTLSLLLVLIKNPLIISTESYLLEKLIEGKNRFISSLSELTSLCMNNGSIELQSWYLKLIDSIDCKPCDLYLGEILKQVTSCVDKLLGSRSEVWREGTKILEQCLKQISLYAGHIRIDNVSDFSEIFSCLLSGAKFSESQHYDSRLTIISMDKAALIKYDSVIITNCNEAFIPLKQKPCSWFNSSMEDFLEIYSSQNRRRASLYDFYMLLQNSEVIITRAKKVQGALTSSSSFLKKLCFITQLEPIEKDYGFISEAVPPISKSLRDYTKSYSSGLETCGSEKLENSFRESETTDYVYASSFPKQIWATDVEMLMRCPYAFYAKHILKLRSKEKVGEPPSRAEFGNFIHRTFDVYNKNRIWNQSIEEGELINKILKLGAEILEDSTIPQCTRKIWYQKLAAIVPEFIKFDAIFSSDMSAIITELRGSIELEFSDQKIELCVIADRVQYDFEDRIVILDYKTGGVPTMREINSGLSPQMILCALVAQGGGFGLNTMQVPKLFYVKIANSEPRITTTEICITQEELNAHADGLRKLLADYVSIKKFSKDIDLLRYNPYKLLQSV
jgi:ATP-dependent helicase/nuclease subunit B